MGIDRPTGERGVFKFEQPKYESKKVNSDVIDRDIIRGEWRYDLETDMLVPHERMLAPRIHSVITDEIPPTLSMTGSDKTYTSKRKLRAEYRDLGFVETGGEQLRPKKIDREERRRQIREDVEKANNLVKYGMAPLTDKEREQCLREDRSYLEFKKTRSK